MTFNEYNIRTYLHEEKTLIKFFINWCNDILKVFNFRDGYEMKKAVERRLRFERSEVKRFDRFKTQEEFPMMYKHYFTSDVTDLMVRRELKESEK